MNHYDLTLSLFPWAKFRKTKGAIKLHAMLDLRGNIPAFLTITEMGKKTRIFLYKTTLAWVAELVDARDLKSLGA